MSFVNNCSHDSELQCKVHVLSLLMMCNSYSLHIYIIFISRVSYIGHTIVNIRYIYMCHGIADEVNA